MNVKPTLSRTVVSLAAIALVAGAVGFSLLARRSPSSLRDVSVFDSQILDQEVAFNEARVKRDPEGAIGYQLLAGSYLHRARETQTAEDAARAEQAARTSIRLRRSRNAAGYWQLGQSLMQQHRFAEALAAARAGLKVEPGNGSCLRLSVDAQIELGQLDEAEMTIKNYPVEFPDKPVAWSIRARLLEARGATDEAIGWMQRAAEKMSVEPNVTGDSAAWFHTKLGQMLSVAGRQEEADLEFTAALRRYPRDWKALLGRARVALIADRAKDSLPWLDEASRVVNSMELHALRAEAYAALGDTARMAESLREIQVLHDKEHLGTTVRGGHTHDRQYAWVQLDWELDVSGALELARQEFSSRPDFGAMELVAWALFRNGNQEEAATWAKKLLATSRETATSEFHTGLILGSSDRTAARNHLSRALEMGLLPRQRVIAENWPRASSTPSSP